MAWQFTTESSFEWPIAKVWELVGEFGGMHKWATTIVRSCRVVEGAAEEAGCVRSLVGVLPNGMPSTALEKLLERDEENHKLKYLILQSKGGPNREGLVVCFHFIQTSPVSTKGLWSYEVPPVPGFDEASFKQFGQPIIDLFISDLRQALSH